MEDPPTLLCKWTWKYCWENWMQLHSIQDSQICRNVHFYITNIQIYKPAVEHDFTLPSFFFILPICYCLLTGKRLLWNLSHINYFLFATCPATNLWKLTLNNFAFQICFEYKIQNLVYNALSTPPNPPLFF